MFNRRSVPTLWHEYGKHNNATRIFEVNGMYYAVDGWLSEYEDPRDAAWAWDSNFDRLKKRVDKEIYG